MNRSATFSPCRTYRYTLWHRWSEGNYAVFIGLNPSTADETTDDPTIRRCVAFAQAWGYGALCMTNLFAYRATAPTTMMAARDPVGPSNNRALQDTASAASLVVAAWGAGGIFQGRDHVVRSSLPQALHYLRLTKDGHPGHPLYLPKTLTPVHWSKP